MFGTSKLCAATACLIVGLLVFSPAHSGFAQSNIESATVGEEGQKAPEVSTSEVQKILREHSAVILDVRPFKEYAMGHIPGALNVAPQPGESSALYISDVDRVGRLVNDNADAALVLYCNGPFCEKSKLLAEKLLAEGYTNVRRYQLGLPVWRALGGPTQIELAGVAYILAHDRSAVFVDARDPADYRQKTLPGAVNLPRSTLGAEKDGSEVRGAKEDAHLPSEDHNTRVIVFGNDAEQSRAVAEALAKEAFSNVSYFAGSVGELLIAAAVDDHK